MWEFIQQPWEWYVAGPLITAVMGFLLFFGREFGVSANLRTICSACGADETCEFFRFDWKSQRWNLLFAFGAILGGAISNIFLTDGTATAHISEATIQDLTALGISFENGYLPENLFSWNNFNTLRGWVMMLGGGFLIGFGSRYAGGCTSGHAISGLSNLQLPSLIAVIGFFIGGLLMTHILLPLILKL